jgi:hypothetical protein
MSRIQQYTFAVRNVQDKLAKVIRDKDMLVFYWQTYLLSQFETVTPDSYLVSYPKCGRTWLRVMLQQYLRSTGQSLRSFRDKSLLNVTPYHVIRFEHDQGSWIPAPPRMEQLSFDVLKYGKKKVIFLARDPRDVLVSSWYHLKYRENIYKGELSEFVRDELVGIHKVVAFMNMWVDNQYAMGEFLLLTYEQLHRDPHDTLRQMLTMMGVDVQSELVEQAVAASTFDKMKQMEQSGSLREPWMKPGAKNSGNSFKIRKGKVGGFRQELSEEDIAFVNRVIQDKLSSRLPYHQEHS